MGSYKQRFVEEYAQLSARYDRLVRMLDRYENGTLDFTFDCPVKLLTRQALAMLDYKTVLEERARFEHIELHE